MAGNWNHLQQNNFPEEGGEFSFGLVESHIHLGMPCEMLEAWAQESV